MLTQVDLKCVCVMVLNFKSVKIESEFNDYIESKLESY